MEHQLNVQTNIDHTENGEKCFVTGNDLVDTSSPGQADVDGGTTILYSDVYDLYAYNDVLLTYWRWYTNNLGNNPGNDIWNVQVSSDDGLFWIDLENTTSSLNEWSERRFVLSEYIDLTNTVQFRFIASDIFNNGDNGSGGSLVEAAIDDFKLEIIGYNYMIGDINYDSIINILDVIELVNIIIGDSDPTSSEIQAGDVDGDGVLNVLDIINLVNIILG